MTTNPTSATPIDDLDRRVLALFTAEPRLGVLEASRRLQVARGTVQARLDRMQASGVLASWAPTVSPRALGYTVTAFITLEIAQRLGRQGVLPHLRSIPEVLESWTVTGTGDLWCRIVARSSADVQRVVDRIVANEHVVRTSTVIAMSEPIPYRTAPLVQATRDR